MKRQQIIFLALIGVHAAHSIEEYLGRLWVVFPPTAFITGLVSEDRRHGFVFLSVGLVGFGLWCLFWHVRRGWRSAKVFIWFWIVIEVINGIAHPLRSIQQRAYTPGLATAPILLILAISLLLEINRSSVESNSHEKKA